MVWINPQSKDYATMSQLEYYRDKDYDGWLQAAAFPRDGKAHLEEIKDTTYDTAAPNKLWNIDPGESIGVNANQRQIFAFSVEIDLEDDLNIGLASTLDDLKSQMFLLRAENPDQKCDIITYAPQGDTMAPTIGITTVTITRPNGNPNIYPQICTPGEYANVEQFENNDVITISGEWSENSTEYLDFDSYLKPNFEFLLNGVPLTHEPNRGIDIAYSSGDDATAGTFIITVTLGDRINKGQLRDTLMINMKVHDFGGNPAEIQASWLVKGDTLTFLRISSEDSDDTYKTGDKIELYLEFSKPVRLNPDKDVLPVLNLNPTGNPQATATYGRKDGTVQTIENTRQYFTYEVQAGQNTTTTTGALNVSGIQGVQTGWNNDNYRFRWIHIPSNGTPEEVRLTTTGNGTLLPTVATNIQSLAAGKQISIDTTAPTISSVAATAGRHPLGAEVFITVTFSENVTIGTPLPFLTLGIGKNTIADTTNDISVTRNTIRFRYVVQSGDTTGTNVLTVTGSGGTITDIAGNPFTYSGGNRTLANVYLDTLTPTNPQIQIVYGTNNTQVNNTVSGATRNGISTAVAPGGENWDPDPDTPYSGRVNLVNVYNNDVKIQITARGSPVTYNTDYFKLEYSTNNGKDWVLVSDVANGTTVYSVPLSLNGTYNVTARQTDAAGNVSEWTVPISFTLDPGNLITRIDSTTPNGIYSDNTTTNQINVTIYFRKALNFVNTNTQSITLNVTRGAAAMPAVTQTVTSNNATSLPFTYTIANNDNTPTTGTVRTLNVTALSLQATDAGGVNVSTLLTLPTDTSLQLGYRKDITVSTGPLNPVTNPAQPVYTQTGNDAAIRTADAWSGTIAITFNRAISKGSGDITIAQNPANYRLPAVLTEAQSARYRNARNFNANYTRGTNGFINNPAGSDTATKYVLNYAVDTIVTPNDTGSAIEQMAYDFLQAEKVTLPVTSQDVTITGTGNNTNTLTITLTGSNALQVLGAAHTVTIPANCVQDSLGYRWPATAQTYTYTTPLINKSFVRVDKQINRDTVTRTANNGSATNPWLTTNQILQTRARLDCRTPNSYVRYNTTSQRFDARGAANTATGTTTNGTGTGQTTSASDYRNTDTNANNFSYLTQSDPQNNGTNYNTFTGTTAHITVGDTEPHGYVWRITTRGRNSQNGTIYSDMSEEIAFRTVLTVQLQNMATDSSLGKPPESGNQLWIRGGDAISSSSVPGFPLTWSDDFNSLSTAGKRAGIRLMRLDTVGANFGTASQWKWVTWELNVLTYYDVVLGRDVDNATAPDAAKAWQYGPRTWAYQRGGWSILKADYALYPGKHRWIRIYAGAFNPGGEMNFSHTFSNRPDLATSITYTP
jgi:hypothetical protein